MPGIPEVAKPPELAKRGGAWFEGDAVKIHLGARKAHPGLLEASTEGYFRVYAADPFGNRIELMERAGL